MILPWGEGGACDTGRIPGGHGEAFGAGTSKTAPFRMDVDGEEVKKCALRPPGLGRERKPLRGATQFQTQNASLWPFFCGREKPHLSPGPLLALSWAAPSPAALSTKGPLSVGGCFAYSCAVIAVDGGILPRNQKKVKGIEAKSDFNTVDDKLKALSAQCAHWAPPPQGEARGTWRTDCHIGAMPLLAMTAGAAVLSGPPLSWWSSRADEDIRPYSAPPLGADSPYQGEMSRRDKRDRDPGTAQP